MCSKKRNGQYNDLILIYNANNDWTNTFKMQITGQYKEKEKHLMAQLK